MKRDWDLLLAILRQVEAQPREMFPIFLHIEEHDPNTVSAHVQLLVEAGYIEADIWEGRWLPARLTWSGHEFLAAAADDTRWQKAKDTLSKVGGLVQPVLTEFLVGVIKAQCGLP